MSTRKSGSFLSRISTAGIFSSGIGALLLTIGCSPSLQSNFGGSSEQADYLSGRILPLAGFLAKNDTNDSMGLTRAAYASACDYRDVRVQLYSLDASGNPSVAPLQTASLLDTEARFKFSNPSAIGITASQLQNGNRFLLRVTGCAGAEIRSVLTQMGDFDVTASMALIGMLTQGSVALRSSLQDLSNDDVVALVKTLSAAIADRATPEEAYAALEANAALKDQFESAFGRQFVVADLGNVQPQVVSTTWPTENLPENSTTSFFVGASHWNPNYTIRYLWKLDGASVSTSSAFNYIPGRNAQGAHQLALYVGADNGSGAIDISKPYYYETKTIQVLNSVLPTPPSLSVAGNVTSVSNVSVTALINTGAALANCQSFSTLAVTENNAVAPDDSAFTITCGTSGTQSLPITFSDGTDGDKIIRLWAKDAAGVVSATPSTLTFSLDRTGPVSTLTAVPPSLSNATSFSFVFSGVDAGGTLAGFECKIDSGSYASCVSPKLVTAISAGAHTFSVRAADTLGNVGTAVTTSWSTDLTAPTVTVSSAPSGVVATSSASITFTGSDTGGGSIDRFECNVDSAGYANCVSPLSLTSLTAGSHTVLIRAVDTAGNVSTVSTRTWIVDTAAPVVAVTAPMGSASAIYAGGQALVISWTATDSNFGATPIQLAYSTDSGTNWTSIGSAQSNSGTYTWTIPTTIDSANVKVRVTATDSGGNVTNADSSGPFTVDSTPPTLTSGAMIVNAGESNTTASTVPVSLQGVDSLTKIQSFCLKYNDSTQPAAGHACWRLVTASPPSLTPALTLNLSNYYYQLGFSSGSYNIYAWLKDAAGNISSLSSSGAGTLARDRESVNYIPGTPPVVSDLVVANKDNPSSPIDVQADVQVSAGGSVYIKWRATDAEALGSTPISLYYTTDEVTYNLIASNLANSGNGSCTVNHAGTTIDDQATGCYLWTGGNPSTAFRIRVKATDVSGNATVSGSSYMNLSTINFLGGNTDPGLGGSARSAMFFSNVNTNGGADQGSLAVAKDGTLYFRDIQRGILKVDPQTGNQTLLIRTTGTFSGNNVSVDSATLRYPIRITLDAQDRILVYDYDRIRRIDTTVEPHTISTLIGGGASVADTTTASAVQITAVPSYNNAGGGTGSFFALPNGDIYFQSESFDNFQVPVSGHRIRVFHSSDSSVTSIYLSGTGDPYNASQDLSRCLTGSVGVLYDVSTSEVTSIQASINHSVSTAACTHTTFNNFYSISYDPTTGVRTSGSDPTGLPNGMYVRVVGKNGKLYALSTVGARIYQYNQSTKVWSVLAGTGVVGSCPDNTVATSCNIHPYDMYVTAQDQVYFIDRGKVRIIDSSGRVQTIMGQGFDFGDGSTPLSARLGQVNYFGTTNDDRVILIDSMSFLMREFQLGTGTLQTIAGNGSNGVPNTTSIATQNPLFLNFSGGTIDSFQVNPSTGEPYILRGGGAVARLDRTTSLYVDVVGGGAQAWKTANGQIGSAINFLSTYAWISGFGDSELMVSKANYNGGQVDVYLKGYDLADSGRQYHYGGYDGVSGGWAANGSMSGSGALTNQFSQYDSFDSKWLIPDGAKIRRIDGTTISTLTTAPRAFSGWYYDRTSDLSTNRLFYCSGGRLYRWNINTSVETLLAMPSTMSCRGSRIYYHPTRNTLIFIYSQNGLNGIAEYLSP